ncbi:MAG: hypothetical protein JNM90_03400 [Burkholderiales bacterium]|nr:hypothetical protein [Burkholderiales bacterium]
MSEAGAAAVFADHQRVLALFTQGIVGRHLHLKPFDEGRPAAAPSRISTDGESIRLPAQVADFPDARHNLGAYRIAILHQVGYLECGTFAFDLRVAGERMALPPAAPAPPASAILRRLRPAPRSAELERFFALWPRPALLRRVFATVEALRIDTVMRRRYPGARRDLDRVLAHALGRRPPAAGLRPLASLLEALVQYSLGRPRALLVAADRTGLADALLATAAPVEADGASVYDSAAAALAICAALAALTRPPARPGAHGAGTDEAPPDEPPGLPEAAPAAAAEVADGEAAPADDALDGAEVDFRGELAPDAVFRRLASGRAGTLEHDGAAESAVPEDGAGNDAPAGAARAPVRAAALPPTPRSFLYDEWDCHAGDYKRAWCRVYEHRLRGEDAGFIDDVRRRHAQVARQVRRRFDAIKPESLARMHGEREGEELELERAIQAAIDRRAGHAPDEHLYVRRQRGRREVAAAFLVDMSASTDFPIRDRAAEAAAAAAAAAAGEADPYVWGRFGAPPDPPPPAAKRRVIDIAKESLALMGDALVALGDAHAIYGFSGSGRDNVEFHIAKDFGDPAGMRTWTALAAIEPRRSTRMGPAIRHALAKLARQPERVRVLIIVSDGYPEDQDYGPDRRDIEYGIADTARALAEAERAGVAAFCITIDPAGHDYLRRMCAEDAYLVIDEVAALPAELAKVYRALTTGNGRGPRRRGRSALRFAHPGTGADAGPASGAAPGAPHESRR